MENISYKIGKTDKFSARIILFSICVIFVGFYSLLIVPPAFSQKINPKVEVAGIKVGGKKTQSAKALIEFESKYFDQIRLALKYGTKSFTPSLAELGISVDAEKTVEKAYLYGRNAGLIQKITSHYQKKQPDSEIQYEIKVDEKKYNSYFKKVEKYIQKPPINATLKINSGNIVYVAGKKGSALSSDSIKEEIVSDLKKGLFNTYKLKVKIKEPLIQEPQTLNARQRAEDWLKAKIEIEVVYDQKAKLKKPNQKFTVARNEIGSWITFKENYDIIEAEISKSSIDQWINDFKDKTKIQPVNDKINYVNGKKLFIQKGVSGQEIYIIDFKKNLISGLDKGQGKIKLKTKALAPVEEIVGGVIPGRFPDKYIEIVLSQQKMYVFDGKKLFNIYLVSSGRWGLGTPQGSFKILYKTTWASCKPSPTEYKTCYMPYSMFFTGEGHAIHALPIIDGYQESSWHLGTPVSHGCVRLGTAEAKLMYDWTPEGTPVIIH